MTNKTSRGMYGIQQQTNYDLEGWRNRFNKLFMKQHPTTRIYEFVQAQLKEQGFIEMLIAQIKAGQIVTKNKIYVQISNRI